MYSLVGSMNVSRYICCDASIMKGFVRLGVLGGTTCYIRKGALDFLSVIMLCDLITFNHFNRLNSLINACVFL